MSTLAKVFVVLNLVLAVAFCFMTLTLYAKRTKFKDKWENTTIELNKTKKLMQKDIDELKDNLNKTEKTLISKTQTVKDLTSQLKDREVQIKEKTDELFKAKEDITASEVELEKTRTELDRRHNQIDEMHKIVQNQLRALAVARENEQQARRGKIDMENELNTTIQRLKDMTREKKKVDTELANQNFIITRLREAGVPIDRIALSDLGAGPQDVGPPVHAKVLAVDNAVNLVMLSVGEDDGVRKGYHFTVYRGDKYIGKVEVERTFRDMCSARIMPRELKTGMVIKEGDNASTRVY